jgi:hypothetical protein
MDDRTAQSGRGAARSPRRPHRPVVWLLADGSAGPESDIDLALFAPIAQVRRDARWHQGRALDVFVHPETVLAQPTAEQLYLRGAQVLAQRGDEATRFLAQLEALHAAGPQPLAPDEAQARRVWVAKMLQRLRRGDAEGDYRRHWLLMMALEDYFALRTRWYPGPKKALAWLAREMPHHHALCAAALRPGASDDHRRLDGGGHRRHPHPADRPGLRLSRCA